MDIHDTIQFTINNLPKLTELAVPLDDSCPICLMSFASIFCEKGQDEGVTKLVGCGHLFCRKDLAEWIRGLHGNCPTCRSSFLDIHPPSESDDESSDGGEYLPDDEDEDEDTFPDTDGFSDLDAEEEFDVDEMDLDVDLDLWNDVVEDDGRIDEAEEWGLTDGESLSEGDISLDGMDAGEGPGEAVIGVAGEEGDTTLVDDMAGDDTK